MGNVSTISLFVGVFALMVIQNGIGKLNPKTKMDAHYEMKGHGGVYTSHTDIVTHDTTMLLNPVIGNNVPKQIRPPRTRLVISNKSNGESSENYTKPKPNWFALNKK